MSAFAASDTRPKLRDDLIAEPIEEEGVQWVDVVDPRSGGSFRLYDFEFAVAFAMDGTRDTGELADYVRDELGFDTTAADLEDFVARLEKMGYVVHEPFQADMAQGGNGEGVHVHDEMGDDANVTTAVVDAEEVARLAAHSVAAEDPRHSAPTRPVEPVKAKPPVAVEQPKPEPPRPPMVVEQSKGRQLGPDETSFEGLIEEPKKPAPPKPPEPPAISLANAELDSDLPPPSPALDAAVSRDVEISDDQPEMKLVLDRDKPVATPVVDTPPPKVERPAATPVTAKPDSAEKVEPKPLPRPTPVVKRDPGPPVRPVEEKRSSAVLYLLLLLLVVGGGAAVYYFKVLKKKPAEQTTVTPTPPIKKPPIDNPPPVATIKTATATLDTGANAYPGSAKLEVSGGGGQAGQAVAAGKGRIDEIVAEGTVVAAGDVVARMKGWKQLESKVKERAKSLGEKKNKLAEDAAENEGKRKEHWEKEIARVQGEHDEKLALFEASLIKAPVGGAVKPLLEEDDKVEAGTPVADIGGGGPMAQATFALEPSDELKAGAACTLLVGGAQVKCTIVSAEAGKVVVRVAADVTPLPANGADVQLMKAGEPAGEPKLVIPAEAVRGTGPDAHVLMVKDGKATKQTVVTATIDGANAVVISGLAAGDRVVLGEVAEGTPVP